MQEINTEVYGSEKTKEKLKRKTKTQKVMKVFIEFIQI